MRAPFKISLLCFSFFALLPTPKAFAQRFLSDYDSTLFIRDTLRPFLKRVENLHFSGYIQPQFQLASHEGVPSYEGGNFADSSKNRFMLRRARIKVDYILPAKGSDAPMAMFTFQFDITERGAFARDVFLKLFEPRSRKFSLTAGLFARPYGFEVNLSSASRESPERARISQILMPAERDLGAMVSYESQKDSTNKPLFKFDVGLFNGQGLAGTTDFDSYKDLISRLSLKPFALTKNLHLSAGLSLLNGAWLSANRYRYQMHTVNGEGRFVEDSAAHSFKVPRRYYGADIQLSINQPLGRTELRGEYWRGKQPGTLITSTTPGTLPTTPAYVRPFSGLIFYFIQALGTSGWELVAKYDSYDPNRKVKGQGLGTGFSATDIKYHSFGLGLTHYFNNNVKVVAYHSFVRNEATALAGYTGDRDDDVFTLRLQFKF